MNIKKITLLISVMVLTVVSTFAQLEHTSDEQISAYQDAFGKDKKIVVASLIKLEDADSAKFWTLYDELQIERKEFGLKRVELFKKYKQDFSSLDNESMNKLVKEMMSLVDKDNKMIIKHHNQINKAVGGVVAGQYYQIEMYLQASIRQFYFNMIDEE